MGQAPSLWLLFLYCLPMFRLLCRLVGVSCAMRPWVHMLGRAEWVAHRLRDSVGVVGWLVWLIVAGWSPVAVIAILISVWARFDAQVWQDALLPFARRAPTMHPQEFMNAYFAGFGPVPVRLPQQPDRLLSLPLIDFRSRARQSVVAGGDSPQLRFWPVLHGLCTTVFFAKLIVRAASANQSWRAGGSVRKPGADLRETADALMRIWAVRVAQLARMRIRIEGMERLGGVAGPVIVAANHQSFLDGVLGSVLGLATLPQRGPLHLRYLAAKDHFLDNWLLYRGLHIGRAGEIMDMIFVDRHGDRVRRQQAVRDAATQMLTKQVDIAIFPQGTRAPLRWRADGVREEPGYFTAGRRERLRVLGGHMKKGAAQLAVLAAQQLAAAGGRGSHSPLRLGGLTVVPVGLQGLGVVFPRGVLRVQTNMDVLVRVGDPLPVDPAETVDVLHDRIDHALQDLLGIRARLDVALRCELLAVVDAHRADDVLAVVSRWVESHRVWYPLCDCLLQVPAADRRLLVPALCDVIARTDLAGLEALYQRVVGHLPA